MSLRKFFFMPRNQRETAIFRDLQTALSEHSLQPLIFLNARGSGLNGRGVIAHCDNPPSEIC
jgi:hypothetical protein